MSGRPYVLAMGRCLASAGQFSVSIRTDKDQVIEGGLVVGPTQRTILLRRPDRLAVQLSHPQGRRLAWYDGSKLVCLETARKAYATFPAQGPLKEVFDALRRGNHYVRPLAVLCDADPGPALCARAKRISYIGRRDADGRACNLVRLDRDDAVFELWIADSAQPLLIQAVVRPSDPSETQRVLHFEQWNLQARFSDADFRPQVPADAHQIEMIDMTGLP